MEQSKKTILALSGGGFRGLYTARVLTVLEERAGRPISQCFDLLCGTSIGGIIAMALALEIPAKRIAGLMESKGAGIFPHHRRAFWMKWLKYFRPKYRVANMKQMLDDLFGEHTINDSVARVLVPSVNYSTGRPQFFKTPHCERLWAGYNPKMVDIALATSAAPMFFPIHKFEDTDSCYVDGGLFGNAPGLFGTYEAQHYLGYELENIHLLAIGTMGGEFRMNAKTRLQKGLLAWGDDLFSLTISAQEKVVDYMLQHMLGDRYSLIDELPTRDQVGNIGLDIATGAAICTLNSMGVDSAKKFVGTHEAEKFLSHVAPKFISSSSHQRKSP